MSHLMNYKRYQEPGLSFDDNVPKIKAHFFYSSSLPIDDPLLSVPNTSGVDFKSIKHPLRPFSARDNKALENAWHKIISRHDQNILENEPSPILAFGNSSSTSPGNRTAIISNHLSAEKPSEVDTENGGNSGKKISVDAILVNHMNQNKQNSPPKNFLKSEITDQSNLYRSQELTSTDLDTEFSRVNEKKVSSEKNILNPISIQGFQNSILSEDSDAKSDRKNCSIKYCEKQNERQQNDLVFSKLDAVGQEHSKNSVEKLGNCLVRNSSSTHDSISHARAGELCNISVNEKNDVVEVSHEKDSEAQKSYESSDLNLDVESGFTVRSTTYAPNDYIFKSEDTGTTGKPFVKLPTRPCSPSGYDQAIKYKEKINPGDKRQSTKNSCKNSSPELKVISEEQLDPVQDLKINESKNFNHSCEVPVGISRLHLVKLPTLQMKPIYWSPVNDTALVTRGTWFYGETMYPVEPTVANQLEFGYRELQPWTQTWKDELDSALSVGPAGEEKIAYRLWPNHKERCPNKEYEELRYRISSNSYYAAKFFNGDIAAEGIPNSEVEYQDLPEPKIDSKKFLTAQIIYKDSSHAFILRPNLQPSAYYGRRPLQKIRKGVIVGIQVIRGFDWETWERLHPAKKLATTKNESCTVEDKDPNFPSLNDNSTYIEPKSHMQATDLVLVVHGIGQKLSERVESFNFTHAVNEFRRSVNIEVLNSSINRVFRKNGFGIMVLPVNWRANLSFEDGGLMKDDDYECSKTDYSLSDVTQESLPAVRQMISDVMLDIPYYMSKHKPKMIQAVIQEANRVYRLWCKNNQNFDKQGRVHLIAHSLGSVMVLEILSKQPTHVPELDLDSKPINSQYFDFRTTNCFFAGSPAGFFLLLEQAKLSPRRGLKKHDAEQSNDKDVTEEAGIFGCLALDNIYNVMHYNDPIAYRLNATVDRKYSASLKEAQLPTTSVGLFGSIGRAIKSITPGIPQIPETHEQLEESSTLLSIAHLPSNLEMEVHDFNREEIAEKKFKLLNDNGQIDWYMNSGRGPLEIQYINMLGAHSSYWTNQDFIRMVVVECGRKPGRSNTLSSMRAVKIARFGKR